MGTDRLLTRPKGAHMRPLTSHRLIPWVVIVTTLPTAQKHKVTVLSDGLGTESGRVGGLEESVWKERMS